MSFFTGTPSRFERIDRFKPQQTQALDQVLQQALSGLQAGGGDFAPIAAREEKRFKERTIPSILERLTATGGQSGDSSALKEALGAAGSDLGTNLAALGSQHGMQRQNQLMQLLGMGLTPQQEIGYFGGEQGFLGGLVPGLGQGIASLLPILAKGAIGGLTGGPAGAATAVAPDAASFIASLLSGFKKGPQDSGSITYEQPNVI